MADDLAFLLAEAIGAGLVTPPRDAARTGVFDGRPHLGETGASGGPNASGPPPGGTTQTSLAQQRTQGTTTNVTGATPINPYSTVVTKNTGIKFISAQRNGKPIESNLLQDIHITG